jgi:nucleoside phosphorylase
MTAPTGGRRVAVLAPMRMELAPLVRPLGLRRVGARRERGYAGALGGLEIVAAVTGIGTGAAARAAERALDAGAVERVLVVGIAGGIGPSVAVGDLVAPERVIDLATGAEHRPTPLGVASPRGALATSDRLLADPAEAAALARRGVVAIDMETAAVAAVCARRGVPWSVVRAISDRADDGSTDEAVLGLAGPDGGGGAFAVARFLLTRPWRVPQLVRLGRDARRAAQTAAAAAVQALATL